MPVALFKSIFCGTDVMSGAKAMAVEQKKELRITGGGIRTYTKMTWT